MSNIKSFSPCEGITVYDNAYCHQDQDQLLFNLKNLPYVLGWNDSNHEDECYLHHPICNDTWKEFFELYLSNSFPSNTTKYLIPQQYDLLSNLFHHPIFSNIDKDKITKFTVNLDTIADAHTKHTHPDENVILYYANIKWEDGWGGETKFYDKYGENIIYTSPYVPNRMIHFDGTIVHSFNPPTAKANKYRFSISTFYQRT